MDEPMTVKITLCPVSSPTMKKHLLYRLGPAKSCFGIRLVEHQSCGLLTVSLNLGGVFEPESRLIPPLPPERCKDDFVFNEPKNY